MPDQFTWPSTGPSAQQESLPERTGSASGNIDRSPVVRSLQSLAQLPSEGIVSALGGPQRMVASEIANARTNPRGTVGALLAGISPAMLLDPKTRQQIGNLIYAAFHPNDPTIEANAEHAVGLDKLMTSDPSFKGKLRNFALRTAFETATDPLSFLPAAAGEKALASFDKAANAALHSTNKAVRNTAKHVLTNVPEREMGMTKREISTVNSIRQREVTKARVAKTADERLLKKNAPALQAGEIPTPVRQRLLKEAFVNGNDAMRQQALTMGYKPTESEVARPPSGVLDYNLRENYDPHTGMFSQPHEFDDVLLGEEEKLRDPAAGFENEQKGSAAPETLYERVERRLAAGRSAVRHRATSQAIQEHVGISPELAHSLSTRNKVGGFEALQGVSRAQVDALLATGFPHMRNIAVAGYDAMGERGMALATKFFIQGTPKRLLDRLEESGGSTHFGVRSPGTFSPARLMPRAAREATTGLLDRWDQAVRAARLQTLDRSDSHLNEFEKMDRVNQDIGAYNQRPHFVDFLSGLGANFPQWHNYITPTVFTRAVLRNPGRVARLARAEQNANDAFLGDKPYRITLGGPNDEGASAYADALRVGIGKGLIGRYPTYFGGPSSIGPISYALHPSGQSTGSRVAQFASNFVPFGNVGLSVFVNPFKSQLPPLWRGVGEAAGVYAQKRTPQSLLRTNGEPLPIAPASQPSQSGQFQWP